MSQNIKRSVCLSAGMCSLPRKTQKTDKQNTKNPPEKKLPGGFKTYLNGFIMPF